MDNSTLLNRVEELVTPVLDNLGLELVEREYLQDRGRWVLRLYIDRDNIPVTITDCETASRSLEAVLDVEGVIPEHYVLEVSSPGLNRPLRRPKDFERFAGSQIELTAKQGLEGRRHFSGLLKGLKEKFIVIQNSDEEFLVPLDDLKKAKIKYQF